LAKIVEPTYNGERLFMSNQHTGVSLKCEELAKELNLSRINLEFAEAYCNTFEESEAHIRKLVRATCADRLNVALLINQVVERVISAQLDDSKLPVIVLNAKEDEHPALRALFSKSCVHEFAASDEAPSRESIVSILKTAQ
jgi:hypothetical protein